MADSNVVPEKFDELYAFARAAAPIPIPRESTPVLRRGSVVVELIVASSPALPSGSHARSTVSTKGAAGSTAVGEFDACV